MNFQKHEKYRRQEVWEIVKGLDEKISRNFQQSGYERIDDNLFAFVNIGYQGHAGQTFPNQYDCQRQSKIGPKGSAKCCHIEGGVMRVQP